MAQEEETVDEKQIESAREALQDEQKEEYQKIDGEQVQLQSEKTMVTIEGIPLQKTVSFSEDVAVYDESDWSQKRSEIKQKKSWITRLFSKLKM